MTGYSYNGTDADFLLVRYDSDGTLDATFGTGRYRHDRPRIRSRLRRERRGPAGRQGRGRRGTAGTDPTTTPRSSGTTPTVASIRASTATASSPRMSTPRTIASAKIILQPDGKIVTVGTSHNGSSNEIVVMRYAADGSLDATFGTAGVVRTDVGANHDYGRGVALQSDGRIVIAGYTDNGPDDEFVVVRYNPDGSLDTSFDGDGIATLDFGPGSRPRTERRRATGRSNPGGRNDAQRHAIWSPPSFGSTRMEAWTRASTATASRPRPSARTMPSHRRSRFRPTARSWSPARARPDPPTS